MRSLTRDEAFRIDSAATHEFGIPSLLLMECAGLATARFALSFAESTNAASFVVVAGPGNNGGDGLVAARHLANRSPLPLQVLLCASDKDLERQSPEARLQSEILARSKLDVNRFRTESDFASARRPLFDPTALVIDALFGIGLRRPLAGRDLALVEAMNESGARIVAVDVPSGLDADTGVPLGAAVRAAATIPFGAPKTGLLLPSARAHTGRVAVAEIGFPRSLLGIEPGLTQPDWLWLD